MSDWTKLPKPKCWETEHGEPIVAWWTGTAAQPVFAVVHRQGRFIVVTDAYRERNAP